MQNINFFTIEGQRLVVFMLNDFFIKSFWHYWCSMPSITMTVTSSNFWKETPIFLDMSTNSRANPSPISDIFSKSRCCLGCFLADSRGFSFCPKFADRGSNTPFADMSEKVRFVRLPFCWKILDQCWPIFSIKDGNNVTINKDGFEGVPSAADGIRWAPQGVPGNPLWI